MELRFQQWRVFLLQHQQETRQPMFYSSYRGSNYSVDHNHCHGFHGLADAVNSETSAGRSPHVASGVEKN